MKQAPTSPYTPDLEERRHWLEKQVAALKLVELVAGVIALIARMRAINLELTKRVAEQPELKIFVDFIGESTRSLVR